jgi:dihydrofolate synthase/folylpolyglutamate synthase
LLGIQRHKQAPEMLRALLRPGDRVRIVPIPDHHCWDVASLAAALPDLAACLEPGGEGDAGLERDLDWLTAAADRPVPLVAGSLHLLGEVMPLLDPEA